MKNLKIFTVAFLALAAISCQKTTDENAEVKPVDLKIGLAVPHTKGHVAPVPSGYTTAINPTGDQIKVFVLDVNNKVVAEALYSLDDMTNMVAPVISTTTIAHDILVIANFGTSITTTPGTYANKAAIDDIIIDMANLAPVATAGNEHGVQYAMLYSVGSIAGSINKVDGVGGNPAQWSVTIPVAPVAARLEVSGASATKPLEGGINVSGIQTFTLSGVYLNNIYPSIQLGSYISATGNKIASPTIDGRTANWNYDNFGTTYTGEQAYKAEATAGTGDKVWAYHIAPTTGTDETDVPQIVLHLTDVVYENGNADVDLYVVVKNYKTVGGTPVDHFSFKRGYVYQISDIIFNQSNTQNNADPEDAEITATISITAWEFTPLTPVV